MELKSVSEAATMLGITKQGVRHLINRGILKAEKVGSYYVMREAEIERVRKIERRPGRKAKWLRSG